jgi:hypothetical protein
MATKIVFQESPWGFSELRMGSLTIYCGKVRIKGVQFNPGRAYLNVRYHNGFCIISFEVTDKLLANDLYRVIGNLCREVAQAKLNGKWGWLDV